MVNLDTYIELVLETQLNCACDSFCRRRFCGLAIHKVWHPARIKVVLCKFMLDKLTNFKPFNNII